MGLPLRPSDYAPLEISQKRCQAVAKAGLAFIVTSENLSHAANATRQLPRSGFVQSAVCGAPHTAEFERALVRERTRAGLKAAVARGAKPGNPRMRARDARAIADIRYGHRERYINELLDGRHRWLPTVERLRPHLPWKLVVRQLQALPPPMRSFSERTLVKACRTLVKVGYADAAILDKAGRLPPDTRVARLIADRVRTHPDATLRELATWLSRVSGSPRPAVVCHGHPKAYAGRRSARGSLGCWSSDRNGGSDESEVTGGEGRCLLIVCFHDQSRSVVECQQLLGDQLAEPAKGSAKRPAKFFLPYSCNYGKSDDCVNVFLR